MPLFDELERADTSPPRRWRKEFDYLNRSGAPITFRVRELFERAFANYTGNQAEMRDRFRSDDNQIHFSAAFELLLHELAKRRKLEPSADTPLSGGKPDLKIRLPSGSTAYVEATITQPGNNVHYDAVCDAVGIIEVPGIAFDTLVVKAPSRALPAGKIASALRAHLETIKPSALSADPGDNEEFEFEYRPVSEGNVEAHLRFIPVSGQDGRTGLQITEVCQSEFLDPWKICEGLERKNKKYREVDAPYIVAIGSAKSWVNLDIFREALFRQSRGSGQDRRGFFAKSERKRVSGVLACDRFTPPSLSGAGLLFARNPNAERPIEENPFGCSEFSSSDDEQEWTLLSDAMELPQNWLHEGGG